jgi:hypothetical protein
MSVPCDTCHNPMLETEQPRKGVRYVCGKCWVQEIRHFAAESPARAEAAKALGISLERAA